MDGVNKKYNIEIEVLTPLSIGAGAEKDWARGVDFVVDNDRLYKLNIREMVKNGIKPEELSSYFASKDEKGLIAKLAGKLVDVSDVIIPLPVSSVNDVKAFVKNQLSGKPVLTGSSLKGAIRSVLFQFLRGSSNDGKEVFGSTVDGDEFMRFVKLSDAEFDGTFLVNTKIFNLMGGGGKWTGGWKHGANESNSRFNPIGFNSLYECLMPRQKGYASLMIAEKTLENFNLNRFYEKKLETLQKQLQKEQKEDKQRKIEKEIKDVQKLVGTVNKKKSAMLIENLFALINQHSKDYLEKEKTFFKKYSTEKSNLIVDSINALLSQIPQNNSYCLLKMSAGSGFHSITGDWQFEEDYTTGKFDRKRANNDDLKKPGLVLPKSRKIAIWDNHLALMGFVKLTSLSEEAMRQVEEQRMVEKKRKEQEELARIEEERKKAEAQALAQRERMEREKRFSELISEVEQLVTSESYEKALAKYEEVCAAYPECKQNRVDIEELRWKVDAILAERIQKEEEERSEQERLQNQKQKAEGGVARALTEKYEFGPNEGQFKVTSFKVCQNKVASWMKAAGVKEVPADQQEALFETLKRLKATADKKEAKSWDDFNSGIWKQLVAIVGPETARQWFNELVKPN